MYCKHCHGRGTNMINVEHKYDCPIKNGFGGVGGDWILMDGGAGEIGYGGAGVGSFGGGGYRQMGCSAPLFTRHQTIKLPSKT